MCEINNQNFYEKYSDVVKDISAGDLVAIDCEFSGLLRHERNRLSLFDDPIQRYEKLRRGINDFIALQIGISVFRYNKNEKYEVSTYTFHLFPRPYSSTSDFVFSCDAKSIQFLCEQNFDFNKVFRDGISFTNGADEEAIRRDIDDGSLVRRMRSEMSSADRDTVKLLLSQVNRWMIRAQPGDTMVLDMSEVEPFLNYLIRDDIEEQYRELCTYRETWTRLRIEKLRGKRIDGNRCAKERDRKEELYTLVLGFTRLLQDLVSMKKPIIGHNMFMDILMIYKMFIAPLPEGYSQFKKEVLKVFPELYDTKFLSFELKREIGRKDMWSSNTLINLYDYFKENGRTVVVDMPIIEDKHHLKTPRSEQFHDSGFDSYCTGYVFLKMAHMFSMWDDEVRIFKRASLGNGPVRYLGAVRQMKNCINLMRGSIGHISLDGPDPGSNRPDIILMESRGKEPIDLSEVTDIIGRFDRADIKLLTKRQALIAASNELTYRMIFKHFKTDKKIRLTKYSRNENKHSIINKNSAGFVALGLAGLAFILCYKKGLDPFQSSFGT